MLQCLEAFLYSGDFCRIFIGLELTDDSVLTKIVVWGKNNRRIALSYEYY